MFHQMLTTTQEKVGQKPTNPLATNPYIIYSCKKKLKEFINDKNRQDKQDVEATG